MAKKHVHKYHRVTLTFGQVWACALPTCNHYMPEYLTPTVVGKASICWNCNEPFILDAANMENDKPVCSNCKPDTSKLTDLLEKLVP